MATRFSFQVRQDHLEIPGEFPQDLPARAAGWGGRLGGRNHDDAPELAVAFGERLEHRDPLGANGQAIRSVLDVAAGDDRPVCGFERSADFETRIISMRVLAHCTRCFYQRLELRIPPFESLRAPRACRGADPGSRIPV